MDINSYLISYVQNKMKTEAGRRDIEEVRQMNLTRDGIINLASSLGLSDRLTPEMADKFLDSLKTNIK